MRVIAGKYRSRRLRSLRGDDVRPTSDRLRETLFDVLTGGNPNALAGSVWLDVYAGTGAVGIEAFSRGARGVYFVEVAPEATEVIRENLGSLGITEGFEVLEKEAGRALRQLDSEAVAVDYCFLDPPYDLHGEYEEALGFLAQSRLLQPHSVVIAEHDKHFDPGDRVGSLVRWRALRQGDASLSFYRLEA